MPNVFAVYYKGRPLKETFQNKLLLTPEKLITMKSYRSPLNNSDDIFSVSFPYQSRINPVSIPYQSRIVSVSFPYRFRIVSVSFPYRFRIVLLSSSYHPPIAKRKTIRNEAENNTEWNEKRTNEVRWNKGGQFYHYLSFGFRQGGLKALLWV